MGLGLATALVLAAPPEHLAPSQAGNDIGTPLPDDALPPAADDFFEGQEDSGTASGSPEDEDGDAADRQPDAEAEAESTIEESPSPDGDSEAGTGEGSGGSADSASSGNSGTALAQQVVDLADQERAEAGCGKLRVDSKLTAASQAHAEDMAARDYMDHDTPEGKGPAERAKEAGYTAWSGENVAAGYTSAEAVMEGWMNSPGHRANILNCDNSVVGVGESNTKWAQNFGSQ